MGTAQRGSMLSAGISTLVTGVGSALGGMIGGMPGAIVGGVIADSVISSKIGRGIQKLHDSERNLHRLHIGGDYQDTIKLIVGFQHGPSQPPNFDASVSVQSHISWKSGWHLEVPESLWIFPVCL